MNKQLDIFPDNRVFYDAQNANFQSRTPCPFNIQIKDVNIEPVKLKKKENDIVMVGSWICTLCKNCIKHHQNRNFIECKLK